MKYTYRVWDFKTGMCEKSDLEANRPEDAIRKFIDASLWPENLIGRTFLVAKQTPGQDNHNQFKLFAVEEEPPVKPRLIATPVTVEL